MDCELLHALATLHAYACLPCMPITLWIVLEID